MSELLVNSISSLDGKGKVGLTYPYEAGMMIKDRATIVQVDGSDWRVSPSTPLPYITTGAGMPEGGAFVSGAVTLGYGTGSVRDALDYLNERVVALPDEVDAAGTAQAVLAEHNSKADAHPELSAFISAEADRAEVARDAAQLSGGIYATTAAGLASGAEYFSVPSVDSAEYLILYRNESGVAVEKNRYPSSSAVQAAITVAGSNRGFLQNAGASDVAAYDDFNRPDGPMGTSDFADAWEVLAGTVSIANKKAAGNNGRAVVDTGASDGEVVVVFDPASTVSPSVVFRAVNASNYLYLSAVSSGPRLGKVVNGTAAVLSNPGGSVSTTLPVEFKVRLEGRLITVYQAGALSFSYALTDADFALFGASTKHGIDIRSNARVSLFYFKTLDQALVKASSVERRQDVVDSWLPDVIDPAVIAYDTFLRIDGPIGMADSGQAWSILSGSLSVLDKRLLGADGLGFIDAQSPDIDLTIEASTVSTPGNFRIIFRLLDATNYLYISYGSDNVILSKSENGILSPLASTIIGDIPAPAITRIVASKRALKVYLQGQKTPAIYHTLSAANYSKYGAATKVGLFLRSSARATKFVLRQEPELLREKVATLQAGARANLARDVRQLTYAAAVNHAASATIEITNFGFDFSGGGVTKFRGAVLAPTGDIICITRDSGFFIVIKPDGTAIQTGFGLTPEQLAEMNVSGGCVGPDGKIYSPPRDSGKVLIIDPAAWLADPANYIAELTDFGIDLSPDFEDKWTGAVLAPNGLIYCLPTSATDILIIDPIRQTARRSNFGLSWSGGKQFAGGALGPDGLIYLPPYNLNGGVMVIDPLNDTARFDTFGLDMSGIGKWSGTVVGADGKLYCCPRNAPGVLVIDPWKQSAEIKDYGLAITVGGNNWSRFITGPDGKLYGTPADATDILVVDPIAQTAIRTNFGTAISGSGQKWIGGIQGPSGKIYCTPDQARNLLVITVQAPPMPVELLMSPLLNKSP